jgi:protein involved in polysaccharide export with SLBB domain
VNCSSKVRLAINGGRIFFACLAGLTAYSIAVAQTGASGTTRQPAGLRQNADDSELGESRVAAPAEQIRVVLAKNSGLLVELERVVEREAIAKGQLVEDSDLTEQAIYDRLDEDAVFRAKATRLLQRYGYLLPTINPDSEIGKEQDLVIKERARRLVQIEAQEEAESLQRKPAEQSPALASAEVCESQTKGNCREPAQRSPSNLDNSRPEPSTIPEGPFNLGPLPALNSSPVLQTNLNNGTFAGRNDPDSADLLRTAAMSASRDSSALPGGLDQYLSRGGVDTSNLGDILARANSAAPSPDNSRVVAQPSSGSARVIPKYSNVDSPQGTIVRKSSPYSDVPSLIDLYVQAAPPNKPVSRFGADILSSGAHEPNTIPMDLPVGPDYVVGPGDSLAIDLWGSVSQRLQRTVDREGRITLPEYGPVLVSGKTLGEVQLNVQELLRTQLRNVSTDVSLSRLRTVRVYVVGEVVEPGAYDVSSLSTPLNALVAAGGLTERGSLRAIKHYRGKQLIEVVDAYDLLLRGVSPDETRLENGDSLLVPPVGPQVTIEGMVRRPATYELRGNTSLEDVLELAGGVLPAAALKHVEVERIVAHENRTMLSLDLSPGESIGAGESQLRDFQIQDGDRIHIFPIAPYNQQSIYLQGHVLRPGRYSYKEGMTVQDILASYADLLPEPAPQYAEIIRLNAPDFRPSVESFDLSAALANRDNAPKLQPLDTVRIFSKYDFEPAPDVWVEGEVRNPGKYTTSGQARLRDAIYLAGGITPDAEMDSAQVFRVNQNGTMKILSVNLAGALANRTNDDLLLQPRDRILIHRNASKVEPSFVYVKGDVANPGRYPLATNMHVEDLVRAAGGLKPSADSQSAFLAHREASGAQLESLNVNVGAAMIGNGDENKILANGDVLTVSKNPSWNELGATVTLRGEVLHPGTYGIRPGESLNSVLEKAGGFTSQAYPYGTVLTRREVRDLEMKSHEELIARVKAEEVQLKALPENDADQKNLKLNAIAQTETTLTQLETHLPVGRVVLNGTLNEKSFDRSAGETSVRNGDTILVPKKPNYVVVQGQVYNGTAVGYVEGRSANWYLSQAGGLTALADKKGVFVIRADGSVLAARNNRTLWSGDPLDAELMPGDVIVVPEKAPKIANHNWTPLIQSAQVATSIALSIAYLKP